MLQLPGLAVCTLIALVARQLPIDAVFGSLVLGILLAPALNKSAMLKPGIVLSGRLLLPIAIALMGVKLDVNTLREVSGTAIAINLLCIALALGLTVQVCKWLKVERKLAALIAIGTGICGGTAIAAAAPILRASNRDFAVSAAIITLFGSIAIVLYPPLGALMGMSEEQFGLWAGTAIHAVAQVIAAAMSYGPTAGNIATVVKMGRVLLLGPLLIALSLYEGGRRKQQSIWTLIPPFIIGYLVLFALRSLQLIPHEIVSSLSQASTWLICIGMAAVGLGSELRGIFTGQRNAIIAGFASACILALSSAILILLFAS